MPPPPAQPPAPAAAGGTPSIAAVVRPGTDTGHCLLDVEAHWQWRLPIGQFVTSGRFSAGGRSWRLRYYPNGNSADSAKYVAVSVGLDDDGKPAAGEPVEARAQFSLLDQAGEPVPSLTQTTAFHNFFAGRGFHGFGYPQSVLRSYLEDQKDSRFTVRCDVTVCARSVRPLVAVPPSDLHRHLGDLLAAEVGTDVTFQVGGEVIMAHRFLLAARSTVLRAELFGQMREGTDPAAVIRVDDMEADVFRALLGFLYTDRLPDDDDDDLDQHEAAAMAQHLLVAADRYNLERLKLLCEDKLCRLVDVGSAATSLALAEQHHCRGLKHVCLQFLAVPQNLKAVMATDEGFDHLARSCPSVLQELISSGMAACALVHDWIGDNGTVWNSDCTSKQKECTNMQKE